MNRKMKDAQGRISEIDGLINCGDLRTAREKCRELRALSGKSHDGLLPTIASFYEARILMHEGRYAEAAHLASSVLGKFRELGSKHWIAWTHLVLSALRIRLGAYAEARSPCGGSHLPLYMGTTRREAQSPRI